MTLSEHWPSAFQVPLRPITLTDFGPTGVIATLTNRRFWTRPSSIDKALHSPSAPHTNFRLPIGKAPAKASLPIGPQPLYRSIASPRQLSKVLRTKCGFRQWIAAPKPPRSMRWREDHNIRP
jgi:hypothetical protein